MLSVGFHTSQFYLRKVNLSHAARYEEEENAAVMGWGLCSPTTPLLPASKYNYTQRTTIDAKTTKQLQCVSVSLTTIEPPFR